MKPYLKLAFSLWLTLMFIAAFGDWITSAACWLTEKLEERNVWL